MAERVRRLAAAATGALCVAALTAPVATAPVAAAAEDGRVVFRIRSGEVTESSSLVVSTTRAHLAYTTNDSGDDAVVYAVDTRTGDVVGHTYLAGVDAVDVEALAGGGDGSLVVADIGDNDGVRSSIGAYRIPQPGRGDTTVTPEVLSLRYSDGPRDAESVLYDAQTGRVYVISKEFGDAHVYRSARDAFDRGRSVLRPVAVAPPLATDATFLPGGEFAVVRGYGDATVLRTAGWRAVTEFDLPPQEQGESIAAPASGDVVWVGTEGNPSPVLQVRLPELPGGATTSPPTTTPGGSPGSPSTGGDGGSSTSDNDAARQAATWVGGGALAALLVVLALLAWRGTRSRHEAG